MGAGAGVEKAVPAVVGGNEGWGAEEVQLAKALFGQPLWGVVVWVVHGGGDGCDPEIWWVRVCLTCLQRKDNGGTSKPLGLRKRRWRKSLRRGRLEARHRKVNAEVVGPEAAELNQTSS